MHHGWGGVAILEPSYVQAGQCKHRVQQTTMMQSGHGHCVRPQALLGKRDGAVGEQQRRISGVSFKY